MKLFILLAAVHAVLGGTLVDRADVAVCNPVCIKIYRPVCGTDGVTYGNECMLDYAVCMDTTIGLHHQGPCKVARAVQACPEVCGAVYDPVCGTDGHTYSNDCVLRSANCQGDVTVAHTGPC